LTHADGGLKPEVLARGLDVWTIPQADSVGYQTVSGTSLASPLVAGAVSERWSFAPQFPHPANCRLASDAPCLPQ